MIVFSVHVKYSQNNTNNMIKTVVSQLDSDFRVWFMLLSFCRSVDPCMTAHWQQHRPLDRSRILGHYRNTSFGLTGRRGFTSFTSLVAQGEIPQVNKKWWHKVMLYTCFYLPVTATSYKGPTHSRLWWHMTHNLMTKQIATSWKLQVGHFSTSQYMHPLI
jgi:hypothetical protein